MVKAVEHFLVQTFIAKAAVERVDEAVLLRFAGRNGCQVMLVWFLQSSNCVQAVHGVFPFENGVGDDAGITPVGLGDNAMGLRKAPDPERVYLTDGKACLVQILPDAGLVAAGRLQRDGRPVRQPGGQGLPAMGIVGKEPCLAALRAVNEKLILADIDTGDMKW